MKQNITINCCPYCGSPMSNLAEVHEKLRRLSPEHSSLASCDNCLHMIGLWAENGWVYSATLPANWILDTQGPEVTRLIHEEQEEKHRARGHWG